MTNIKNLINEIKDIINTIKTKQDANTAWTGTEKSDIETRIKHILDKTNPHHTNLTEYLKIDLKELEQLEKTLGEEKIKQTQEKKQLEDDLKKAQEDNQAKDALIKQKDEEIGKKITSNLITSLESLTKDGKLKIDETKLTELKTTLEELKGKGVNIDLTDTNKKIEELKETAKKEEKLPYWSIGACIIGGLVLMGVIYIIFTKPQKFIKNSEDE